MVALKENDTLELVPLPEGKKLVENHWVCIVKLNFNGFLSCLVRRSSSKHGLSAKLFYSTQDKLVHILISLAAITSAGCPECLSWYFGGRGLYGATSCFCCSRKLDMIFRLKKLLYGLKKILRAWFGKFFLL